MYASNNSVPLAARPKLQNFTKFLANSGGYLYCIIKYGGQDHVFIRHKDDQDIYYLGPDIWPNNDVYYLIENYPELVATNNVAGGQIALRVRDIGFELEEIKKTSNKEIQQLREENQDYKVLYDLAAMEVEEERKKTIEVVNSLEMERKTRAVEMEKLYKKTEEELKEFQETLETECRLKLHEQKTIIQRHEEAVRALKLKTCKMKDTEDAVQEKLLLIMEQLVAMNKLMLHVCKQEKKKEEDWHNDFSNPFKMVLNENELLRLNLFDDIVLLIEDIVREHKHGDPSPKSRTAKTRKYHSRTANIYQHILPNGNYQLLTIGQHLKINPWPLISRTISIITSEILTKRMKTTNNEDDNNNVEERQYYRDLNAINLNKIQEWFRIFIPGSNIRDIPKQLLCYYLAQKLVEVEQNKDRHILYTNYKDKGTYILF
jgi:hypothetical protein